MAEVILKDDTWLVERQPGGVTDPMVVRFRKTGRIRTLLDQTARWTPAGWDQRRWIPRPPIVPASIIAHAATRMRLAAEEIAYRERMRDWSIQRLADRQQEAGE